MAVFNMTGKAGSSGGGTDTSDATAYAENIELGFTAYARGSKLTGTADPPKEVPVILSNLSVQTSSGTSLTINIPATIGRLVILTIVTRSNIASVTAGWSFLVESPHIISTPEQRNYIYYKIATSPTESVTVTQSSAQRLYLTGICFATDTIPTVDSAMSQLSTAYNYITYTKPLNKTYVIALSGYYWTTSSPYPLWASSPVAYKAFQLGTTTQSRLLTFIDDETPISRTITNPASGSAEDYKITMCAVYF